MPRFSANLGFLWQELPLLERIRAAARAGFKAVEMHWPYDVDPKAVRATCAEAGVTLLGINTVRGDVAKGENGLGALPGREAEPTGHWMIRDAADRGTPTPVPGLALHRVASDADMAWFEQLIFLAADGRPPTRPGEMHPPGSQGFPGAAWLYAELDGVGVGTAASIVTSQIGRASCRERVSSPV